MAVEETRCGRIVNLVSAFVYFVALFVPFVLLFVIGCLFCVWRLFVALFLRRKYGEKITFLPGLDAMCAIDCEVEPINVTAILKLKGEVNINYLKRVVLHQMVESSDSSGRILHPTLTRYVHQDCGYYFWLKERQFSIDDHVKLYDGVLPKNDEEFNEICAKYCTRHAPFGKSPWQFIAVPLADCFPGLGNEPHYRIILSLLHAMADGVSLVGIITTHLLDEPLNELSPVLRKKNNNSFCANFYHNVKTFFFLPRALYRQLMISDRNILHGKKLSGVKFIGFSKPTSLERIQKVRRVTSSTINDVLMSCVAGALRSYFKTTGEEFQSATAVVPIAKHDYTKNPELKNSCSFVPFSLPIDIDDAMRRLGATKVAMSDIKKSPNVWFNFYGFQFFCNRLPKSITRLYLNTLKITCIVSNVPGCQQCQTMCNNHSIEGAGFILPNRGNIGVGISLLSYNNQLQVGLIIDGNLIRDRSDIDVILTNFEKELQILEKETIHLI